MNHTENLLTDFLFFTKVFFKLIHNKDFIISQPISNRSHIYEIISELYDVFLLKHKRVIINIPPGWSKAIDCQTPILTYEGWKKAKEIKMGDQIVGSNGWTTVMGVYPQGLCKAKQIIFSDRTSVVCNDDHLWTVYNRDTMKPRVKSIYELTDDLYEADRRKKWRIPLLRKEFTNDMYKPEIDPYLLGCWLGDGCSAGAAITTMDQEIVQEFEKLGHVMRIRPSSDNGKAKTYAILDNGFCQQLKKANQLKNKHFPRDAYWWSSQDKLALLQGLMDTDGCCESENGRPSFCNTNITLIEGVEFLISSVGGTSVRVKSMGDNYPAITLKIRVPRDVKLFRLQRKQKLFKYFKNGQPRRLIKEIKEVEACEMVCFKVDAPDKLFAITHNLILTHNSELVKMFICWATAHYPDSRHIYISYSHELASAHTADIKRIMQTNMYEQLFNVKISGDTRAKDFFMTSQGGAVAAFGSSGAITGRDAGLPGLDRYTGAVIADDLIKPDEAHSETIRERVRRNFFETIVPRCRGINVPIVVIGQRLHEDDICATLLNEYADEWRLVEIEALDVTGHSRYPEQISTDQLKKMKEKQPYVFWSQYQQKPIPAGGALYKDTDFITFDTLPDIYATFVTCDTAETEKTWNDKTVFSFWGLYRPIYNGVASEQVCLHWLDCWELSIEPADLEIKFLDFWASCMQFKVKPTTALIEKKSTGVTLVSILQRTPGIRAIGIERTKSSGSKTQRFIDMQYYIASRLVSLPSYGKHTRMCLDHMVKITANNSHRFDDIADTCYDAVKAALIDKLVVSSEQNIVEYNHMAARMVGFTNRVDELRRKAHGSGSNSPRPTRPY